MRKSATILICALALCGAHARTKTSTHKLTGSEQLEVARIVADADTLPSSVDPDAISIKGYTKKASDSKESFFVTNHTNRPISQLRLRMRYTTTQGEPLHERVATVNVTLGVGETRLVSVRSWDTQRRFYYYAGTKPRKSATPYKVAYRLIGYSIPIGDTSR